MGNSANYSASPSPSKTHLLHQPQGKVCHKGKGFTDILSEIRDIWYYLQPVYSKFRKSLDSGHVCDLFQAGVPADCLI